MATPGIEQLRDIHPPLPPHLALWQTFSEWLPLLVGAALLAGIGWYVFRYLKQRLPGAAKKQALAALRNAQERYAGDGDAVRFAREVDRLLRREAMRRYPEQNLRRLTGDEWLAFLDRTAGMDAFSSGPGRCLSTLPYQRQGRLESAGITALVAQWLEH
jgi:hypothetical protein